MPSWCNNNFSITGNTESIKELWDTAQTAEADNGSFGLLNAIMPMPEELKGTTAPSEDGNDWYHWRVKNWGTKWDVSNEGLEFMDHGDGTASIEGWFDSAWAPPIGAYEQLAADFDSCVIECSYYDVDGYEFGGFWSSKHGHECCGDLRAEYELPEDERSGVFHRLDREYGLSEQLEP